MGTYNKNDVVTAVVSGFTEYGIFVILDNNYTGLIHISEISDKFVRDPKFFVDMNEIISVEILDIDEINKQLKLSIKNHPYRKNGSRRKKIIETKHGFSTLAYKLPYWIDENIKTHNN